MSDTTTAADADTGDDGGAPPYDVETHARNMGWKPKEQWKGDTSKWEDAQSFVDRTMSMVPLLQARNKDLDKTIAQMKRQMDQQTTSMADLVRTTRKAEQVGYNRAMRELAEKRRAAIREGDEQAVEAVEQEMRELGPAPPPPDDPKPNGAGNGQAEPDPVAVAWAKQNPWFRQDPIAAQVASMTLDQLEREEPDLTLEERLTEVTRRIRRRFPEHFQTTRQRQQQADEDNDNVDTEDDEPAPRRRSNGSAMVATPSTAPGRGTPKPRSFDAMPAEVKREYNRQVKMLEGKGEPLSKDEYSRYYWEQFPEDGT